MKDKLPSGEAPQMRDPTGCIPRQDVALLPAASVQTSDTPHRAELRDRDTRGQCPCGTCQLSGFCGRLAILMFTDPKGGEQDSGTPLKAFHKDTPAAHMGFRMQEC